MKKSLFKRILKWFAFVILFLLILIILLPVFFKGKIIKIVKTQANESVNAVIDFDDKIKLNLISSFPNFTLGIKNLSVVNKAPFEGDTLASIGAFEAKLNLMSVISGDQIEIKKIILDDPKIYLHVLPDGSANWDIALPDSSEDVEEVSEGEEESDFNMGLQYYAVNRADFVFEDEQGGILVDIKNLNHSGEGDFTMSFFNLATKTDIEKLSFAYGGIKYMNKAHTKLDATLEIDMDNSKYSVLDNLLQINDFFLKFNGFVAMPDTNIRMNLAFEAPETDFRNLISLIPAIFMKDFESLKTSGKMAFNGNIDGVYNAVSMPAFDFNLNVDQGMFQYPDLPAAVNNVNLKLKVSSKDGNPDHTVVNLSKLHFELDKEPFDAHMLVKTPVSDPYLEAYLKGKINLSQVKDIIELEEGSDVSGIINTDLEIKGNLSTIENEAYEDFHAIGRLMVSELIYQPEPKQKVQIPKLSMEFTPRYVNLEDFLLKMGKNDVSASGSLSNFIPYVFGKGTLLGVLSVKSEYFNLNPIMQATASDEEVPEETNDTSSYELEAIELPGNIDFSMDASFKKLIYDDLHMSNIICALVLRDKKLEIKDMNAGIFDGSMKVQGHYDTRVADQPNVDLNLDIQKLKFSEAYNAFGMIRKYAPILKYAQGDFNAKMKIKSDLDKGMMPVYPSFFSEGVLDIPKAAIEGSEFQSKLASALKNDDLKSFSVGNIKPSYIIENGQFRLKEPLKFNIDKTACTLDGSTGLDQSLSYAMDMKIPAKGMKEESDKLVSSLSGGSITSPMGDFIDATVLVTGTIDQPKIKVSLSDLMKDAKDQLMDQARDELNKKKQEAKDKANEEVDKAKQEAEEKARQEKERLKREAEQQKKEAEEKARQEAEKKKKEAEEEAKKKLKKLF